MNYADLFRVTLPETALEIASLAGAGGGSRFSAQGSVADARDVGRAAGGGWMRCSVDHAPVAGVWWP